MCHHLPHRTSRSLKKILRPEKAIKSSLTLFRQMDLSTKLHYTIKPGWSIVYIESPQVIIYKKYCMSSLKIDFVMQYAAFHLGLQLLHIAAFHLGIQLSHIAAFHLGLQLFAKVLIWELKRSHDKVSM